MVLGRIRYFRFGDLDITYRIICMVSGTYIPKYIGNPDGNLSCIFLIKIIREIGRDRTRIQRVLVGTAAPRAWYEEGLGILGFVTSTLPIVL